MRTSFAATCSTGPQTPLAERRRYSIAGAASAFASQATWRLPAATVNGAVQRPPTRVRRTTLESVGRVEHGRLVARVERERGRRLAAQVRPDRVGHVLGRPPAVGRRRESAVLDVALVVVVVVEDVDDPAAVEARVDRRDGAVGARDRVVRRVDLGERGRDPRPVALPCARDGRLRLVVGGEHVDAAGGGADDLPLARVHEAFADRHLLEGGARFQRRRCGGGGRRGREREEDRGEQPLHPLPR